MTSIEYGLRCMKAVEEAKCIIDEHCFEHRIQSKEGIICDMMKTSLDDVADTLAEALNVIYAIKEALNEASE